MKKLVIICLAAFTLLIGISSLMGQRRGQPREAIGSAIGLIKEARRSFEVQEFRGMPGRDRAIEHLDRALHECEAALDSLEHRDRGR